MSVGVSLPCPRCAPDKYGAKRKYGTQRNSGGVGQPQRRFTFEARALRLRFSLHLGEVARAFLGASDRVVPGCLLAKEYILARARFLYLMSAVTRSA